jgi:hypothetical protein
MSVIPSRSTDDAMKMLYVPTNQGHMFVDAKRDMMLMELHAQVRLYQLIDI